MNVLPLRNVLYGRPRSQISSRNLMNALKANLLPSVIKNVHVIGIRCVFDFIDRREAVQQLAARRRLLEKKLRESNEVWLIVSAVTAISKSEAKEKDKDEAEEDTERVVDDGDESEATSSCDRNASMNPGVSFWIGVKVPDSMLQSLELTFMRLFSQCGFSIYSCKAVYGRNVNNREENACKTLFRCIKDYNWPYAVALSRESAESFLRDAVPGASDTPFNTWDPEFGPKVVRITLTENALLDFATDVRNALTQMSYCDFDYDMVDKAPSNGHTDETRKPQATPSAGRPKLIEAMDLFIFSLTEFDCKYKCGYVYEKEERSTCTYVKRGTVRDYLGALCEMDTYRDVITTQLNNLVIFLENNPKYQGIANLEVDLNLIEVLDGWFFNIEEKCFTQKGIDKVSFGVITPRAFFAYKYTPGVIPYPKEYDESIRNSFTDSREYTLFLQMLYQLLMSGRFPFKSKKMICVGPSNSGKTSWIAPFLSIMDMDHVATVTREGKFSAHMLTQDTQLLFVDEWAPDSMAVDEAKRIFQGGEQFIPTKHGIAKRMVFNSGIYITCNVKPDFGGGEDATAIENRMQTFKCKSLPKVVSGMEQKYRQEAMAILHWMAEKLKNVEIFENPTSAPTSSHVGTRKFNLQQRKRTWSAVDVADVTTSVLPATSVELAHLAVYEDRHTADDVPYRLRTYDLNSVQYHHSVHLDICGKFRGHLNLDGEDVESLFKIRRKNAWMGRDSLYDAWLLANCGEFRAGFNMDEFTKRYPNWKAEKETINFTELDVSFSVDDIKRENVLELFKSTKEIKEVIELSD